MTKETHKGNHFIRGFSEVLITAGSIGTSDAGEAAGSFASRSTADLLWDFETSKPIPSDTFSPTNGVIRTAIAHIAPSLQLRNLRNK